LVAGLPVVVPFVPGNTSSTGAGDAFSAVNAIGLLLSPVHILNAPTQLMKDLGYGAGYAYDHATEGAFSEQNHVPDGVGRE
jgi:putative ATPase